MKLRFEPTKPAFLYKDEPLKNWQSWTWQLKNALTTEDEFAHIFDLTPNERDGFKGQNSLFKVSSTPYYASLALNQGLNFPLGQSPLRRILMPSREELTAGVQQMSDPLAEKIHSPSPRIIHRYSDRVLFLVTDTCSVYCRFCTRKRFTGKEEGLVHGKDYEEALNYIRKTPGIREVIFSGGDPLTLSNSVLSQILADVRRIEHVEIIRIGTRMPVVCPMRIDQDLVTVLRKNAPVFVMTHFSHPYELTEEAAMALTMLVDHGIPLFNQAVLLNGVNNHAAIIQALSRRLLYLRVKPYYLFQCDPSEGSDHLRTTVEQTEAIARELWGHLSGLAMPTFSLDIPSGGGKTTLAPNFLVSQEKGVREYVGWDGRRGVYKNPQVEEIKPADLEKYLGEWREIIKR